ncbi:MAG: VIT1/CCC1 transporter family protein [Candidatus Saccharibacteria bacterium]
MKSDKKLSVSQKLKHRAALVQQGGVRAAVLGVNDGLVSTLCLVVGVAATGASPRAVLTAGFAGLLAGAISMAAGEWISVKAQVELFEGILKDIKAVLSENKTNLTEPLAHSLAGQGMNLDTAHEAVKDIAVSDEKLIELYSSQIIGLNQDELGSPLRVAISSFVLFAIGSLVPIIPWLFVDGSIALTLSIILTSLAGLFVGGFIANSSGKSLPRGAIRQLLIVLGSAIVTYGIGFVFGVATKG